MSYEVDPEVYKYFEELKLRRKYKWVMFGLDANGPKHVLKSCETSKSKGLEDLCAALPEADCRYVIYEHEYSTKDGRKSDKLYFISWTPRAAATTLKMEYSTARRFIKEACPGCEEVTAGAKNEVLQEIRGDNVEDDDEVEDEGDDWIDD